MIDLIRRSDAIEVAYQLRRKPNDEEWDWWLRSFNAIPSADTEIEIIKAEAYAKGIDSERKRISDWCRPSGEWIGARIGHYPGYECSLCHYGVQPWNTTRYCPNCGARMKGADDDN